MPTSKMLLILIPALGGALILGVVLARRVGKDEASQEITVAHSPSPSPTESARTIESPAPLDPEEQARRLFESGLAKTAHGDYAGAILEFDQVITLKKDWGDAHYGRAVAKAALRDYAGSIADFDRVVDLKKAGPETYYSRGMAKSALGKPKEAIFDYDECLKLRNRWPEALYNRALAKKTLHDEEGARADFLEALATAPADWASRVTVEKLLGAAKTKP
jgi:tetratricopeptide (TPR) repeat protein